MSSLLQEDTKDLLATWPDLSGPWQRRPTRLYVPYSIVVNFPALVHKKSS
jgi:hypothetical protein